MIGKNPLQKFVSVNKKQIFFAESHVALISELDFFYISKCNWFIYEILPVSRLGCTRIWEEMQPA